MLPWLKKFFTDETAFVGLIRASCIGLGTAAATGNLPVPESWEIGGVILAHDRAIAIYPPGVALRTQYALLAVMIVFTATGLLILSGG